MNKLETEIFSVNTLESVSDILNNNYITLKNIKAYREQESQLSQLYEDILKKVPKSLKESFENYDSLVWDTRDYELSLIYHLGIKRGIAINNLNSKK